MSILGIDASLTNTGLVVLDRSGELKYKTTFSPKTKGVTRLIEIRNNVEFAIIDYDPEIIVMEGYSYSPQAGRMFDLGELGGILKVLFHIHDKELAIVQPSTLKKFITGSGVGDKNKVMLIAYKKWGIELDDDHQTDAYGLAKIGIALRNPSMKLLSYEQEVLKVCNKART